MLRGVRSATLVVVAVHHNRRLSRLQVVALLDLHINCHDGSHRIADDFSATHNTVQSNDCFREGFVLLALHLAITWKEQYHLREESVYRRFQVIVDGSSPEGELIINEGANAYMIGILFRRDMNCRRSGMLISHLALQVRGRSHRNLQEEQNSLLVSLSIVLDRSGHVLQLKTMRDRTLWNRARVGVCVTP